LGGCELQCIMKRPFFCYQDFDLVTLILNFNLVLKNESRLYLLNQMFYGFDTWYIDALWRDLSFFWYQDFWLCDLDLELWLSLEKTFNLDSTISFEPNALELWYMRYRCIMKTRFFLAPRLLTLWPWSLILAFFRDHISRRAMLSTDNSCYL
jgi:hypothetical protein